MSGTPRVESPLSSTPSLVDEQPAPTRNSGVPVWDLVIADMRARDSVGRERYGTPLQTHNGRDPLVDAYQEVLDTCVYLRQAIEERGGYVEPVPHREAMRKEIDRLTKWCDELQAKNSELVLSQPKRLVAEFMGRSRPLEWTPRIPPEEQIQHRIAIMVEEFFEMLAETGEFRAQPYALDEGRKWVERYIHGADFTKLNMVKFAHELGDLQFTVMGAWIVFGIDGDAVIREIWRANMDKEVPANEHGKHRKPDGWIAPDIEGVLRAQGWNPREGA